MNTCVVLFVAYMHICSTDSLLHCGWRVKAVA